VLAFAGGLAPLGAGLGLAAPHLAKVGVTLEAVVGIVLVLGGGGLVVTGAARLLHGTRWLVRIPTAVALVVVVALVVPTVTVAVAATHVPPTEVGPMGRVGADLGLREARFPTADGVTLAAWYAPGSNGAGVVVRHGAGSTRSSVLRHAEVLARHGYAVLLVDARGHGDSGGRAMDLGWYGDLDTSAAVTYLRGRPGVAPERIAVLGLSMGGEEAVGALGADERIAAVVAEGATGRAAPDKAWLSEAYGWRGWVQEQIEGAQTALVDLLTDARPPVSLRSAVAAASPRPVLLVAAGAVDDEARAGRFIASGSPDSVQLWVVPGAGHTDGLEVAPGEWERRVVGFLDGALLGEAPP
jgi:dienelactone hydrolase